MLSFVEERDRIFERWLTEVERLVGRRLDRDQAFNAYRLYDGFWRHPKWKVAARLAGGIHVTAATCVYSDVATRGRRAVTELDRLRSKSAHPPTTPCVFKWSE